MVKTSLGSRMNNSSVLLVVVHSSDPDGPLPGVFVFPAGEIICIEVSTTFPGADDALFFS